MNKVKLAAIAIAEFIDGIIEEKDLTRKETHTLFEALEQSFSEQKVGLIYFIDNKNFE